jgi:hypothetical protein
MMRGVDTAAENATLPPSSERLLTFSSSPLMEADVTIPLRRERADLVGAVLRTKITKAEQFESVRKHGIYLHTMHPTFISS